PPPPRLVRDELVGVLHEQRLDRLRVLGLPGVDVLLDDRPNGSLIRRRGCRFLGNEWHRRKRHDQGEENQCPESHGGYPLRRARIGTLPPYRPGTGHPIPAPAALAGARCVWHNGHGADSPRVSLSVIKGSLVNSSAGSPPCRGAPRSREPPCTGTFS